MPRAFHPTPSRDDSPPPGSGTFPSGEQLRILAEVLEAFPTGPSQRGYEYAERDRVRGVVTRRNGFRARVRGQQTYQTAWTWRDDEGWMPACSCPVAPYCKHVYALGCVVLADLLPFEALAEEWLDELLPERLVLQRRLREERAAPGGPRGTGSDGTGSAPDTRAPKARSSSFAARSRAAPRGHASSRRASPPAALHREAAPAALRNSPAGSSPRGHTRRGHSPTGSPPPGHSQPGSTPTGHSPDPTPHGQAPPRHSPSGRPPPSDERSARALDRLRESESGFERTQSLIVLAAPLGLTREAAWAAPFAQLLQIRDPDLRCMLLARELAHATGKAPPAVLLPYHERDDLVEREREIAERALVAGVQEWAARPEVPVARALRLEFGLRGLGRGMAVVTVQARVRSRRLRDEPRTGQQLRQLLAESEQRDDVLPPAQRALLAALFDPLVMRSVGDTERTFLLGGLALLGVAAAADGSPFASWSADLPPQMARRAGLQPGAPLRLGGGTLDAAPVLAAPAAGRPRVVLAWHLPDGRTLDAANVLSLHAPYAGDRKRPLVLAEGALWMARERLPDGLDELFLAAGGFELSPERAGGLVAPLARAFPRFRASLVSHAKVHAAAPIVCLALHPDDWLNVRAFASAQPDWRPGEPVPPGPPVFERTPQGDWVACASSGGGAGGALLQSDPDGALAGLDELPAAAAAADDAPAPGVESAAQAHERAGPAAASNPASPAPAMDADAAPPLLELPDPARLAPVEAWLDALHEPESGPGLPAAAPLPGPAANGRAGDAGTWLRVTPQVAERLADAWERRPAGVDFYGNAALRRLLVPPDGRNVALRIEPSGIDWWQVSAAWLDEALALSESELARLRAADTRFLRLPSGWVRREQALAQDELAGALAELGIEPGGEPQRLGVFQLAQAGDAALATLHELAGGGAAGGREALAAVAALRKKVAAFKGLPRVAVPRGIKATLRPYQREGLDFLSYTAALGSGAILADDMGLGKTLQALAWLARLRSEDKEGGPSLVVCPASVLSNWEREAARFAPGLSVLSLTAGGERKQLLRRVAGHDLVLTNYALLRRDRHELAAQAWRAVVFDEAQNLKNPDALVSRAARELQAGHRLALTGTPLENRALDLWSILACVSPGYLGSRAAFVRRFDRADAPPHARALLAAKLRPVLLRRLKQQVAPELPPRIEERLDCELTPGQRKLYLAELAKGRALVGRLADDGGVARNKISILAVLTRLRQICCHPALAGGTRALGSGKLDALIELLEPLFAEGHKVLVFSQFVELLKLVQDELTRRGMAFHVLTGASRRRGELVDAFERAEGPAAFLVSLKAGGTGLNLTAANYVALLDPWWNPAVEAQAIDRTHRIGQHRTVIAYRLVAKGTLEERILELQERKAALVRGVLGEDGFAKALTREDLDYLLEPM